MCGTKVRPKKVSIKLEPNSKAKKLHRSDASKFSSKKKGSNCGYSDGKKTSRQPSKTGNVPLCANVSRGEEEISLTASTTIEDKKTLQKRARRKYLGNGLVIKLAEAAENNEKSTLDKSYWNSYHCAKELTQHEDGKVTGKYCKNRWCPVCSAIRTAKVTNKYKPVLEEWRGQSYFVTLTAGATVEAKYLPSRINIMLKKSIQINRTLKKQFQRGTRERFQAIRKLECTYRPVSNEFHPHFHFIVKGEQNARDLVKYWLKAFPGAVEAAQDIKPCTEGAEAELFKYFTKLISQNGKERVIYADAMDIIFNAVKGRRTYQTIGFTDHEKGLSQEAEQEGITQEEAAAAVAEWVWDKNDWKREAITVDYETGEVQEETISLSGYEPGEGMQELTEKKVIVRKGHKWESAIFRK